MQVTRPVVVVCVFTTNNKVCKHLISETVPNYIALEYYNPVYRQLLQVLYVAYKGWVKFCFQFRE